jgi:hypothetical protein
MRIRLVLCLALAALALMTAACQGESPVAAGYFPSGVTLFKDDFTYISGGWQVGQDALCTTQYAGGGLLIQANEKSTDCFSIPKQGKLGDVHIEVDATKLSGPDNNDFGVICRYQSQDNFYFLKLTSDGYYVIGKFKANQMIFLGMKDYQPTAAALQGAATNFLQVDCVGSKLRLSANGVLIAEAEDSDFATGDVGVIAGSFSEPGVAILFDNFSVTQP